MNPRVMGFAEDFERRVFILVDRTMPHEIRFAAVSLLNCPGGLDNLVEVQFWKLARFIVYW